jgi:hypothetical protein
VEVRENGRDAERDGVLVDEAVAAAVALALGGGGGLTEHVGPRLSQYLSRSKQTNNTHRVFA